jgi:hypothetical protein
MLVPVKRSDNIVVWHLLYNRRANDRISYLDASAVEHADVTASELEKTRHIIGWCSEASSTPGRCMACEETWRSDLGANSLCTT